MAAADSIAAQTRSERGAVTDADRASIGERHDTRTDHVGADRARRAPPHVAVDVARRHDTNAFGGGSDRRRAPKNFFATTPDRAIFDALIADLDPTSPVTSMVRVSRTMHRDDACRVAIDDVTRR